MIPSMANASCVLRKKMPKDIKVLPLSHVPINLNGNLLLIHGMADDNVHFQNCAEYAEHLVQLNKQFDMQVYTNRNHGIYGGNTRYHLYTKLTNFFETNL